MKTYALLAILFLISQTGAFAQVGISSTNSPPDPSAGLDLNFSNKGFLPPRMTTPKRNAISSPAIGLMIYNTDCNDMQYYNGAGWVPMGNTGIPAIPGPIGVSPTPCINSSGVSCSVVPVANATGYHWTVPSGAAISAGQGTATINVNFGNTNGMICVAAYNDCYKSIMSFQDITLAQGDSVTVSTIAAPHANCDDSMYTFIANPTNGGSNPAYQWSVNGSSVTGATSATFTTSTLGTLNCQITSNSTCIGGSSIVSNTFSATPCSSTYYGLPFYLFCDFESGCNNPDASFYWTNSSGTWQSSERNPIIYLNNPGYATDVFYLTQTFAPPLSSVNQGVYFRNVGPPLVIGQSFGGGIIFYIDSTGHHGLIAAAIDQGTETQSGCYGTLIGGTFTVIGKGQSNTAAITFNCSEAGIAGRICNDLVLNGYSDWFLPSKDELNQLYAHKAVAGAFNSANYWSSSESSTFETWAQDFGSGSHGIFAKTSSFSIRAIRSF